MTVTPSSVPPARIIGWAAFLACSWTWVIGMFLPVLLVRDYGLWGFVVFAVPNVIGAGAMGAVLAAPGLSRRIVERHRGACVAFSLVTIAFHAFFAGWMASWLEPFLLFAVLALVLVRLAALVARRTLGNPLANVAPTLVVSLIAVAGFAFAEGWTGPTAIGTVPLGAIYLAPVCVLGFALCPYLDLTFHRARQAMPGRAGTQAFALGFGVFFLAMILFTLAYSGWLGERFDAGRAGRIGLSVVALLVVWHVLTQAIFTVQAHGVELGLAGLGRALRGPGTWAFGMVGVLGVGAGALHGWTIEGLSPGEVGYRLFMAAYGLAFPAYVWICMIPARGMAHTPGAAHVRRRIWLAAVIVAAPCYWFGSVAMDEVWLAPGVLAVLLARPLALALARRAA